MKRTNKMKKVQRLDEDLDVEAWIVSTVESTEGSGGEVVHFYSTFIANVALSSCC